MYFNCFNVCDSIEVLMYYTVDSIVSECILVCLCVGILMYVF